MLRTAAILATLMSVAFRPTLSALPTNPPYNLIIEDVYADIGNFYVTAYCGCEICCGEWAHKRQDGIIRGASGEELVSGYSVAADPSIPFGAQLYIEGVRYEVQDRGGAIKGQRLDIYFKAHEDALAFSAGHYNVKVKIDFD
jgi:3D (Asp-Asp-Asp) domain-containing protein